MDFTRQNNLEKCTKIYFSKLKSHKKKKKKNRKCVKQTFSLNLLNLQQDLFAGHSYSQCSELTHGDRTRASILSRENVVESVSLSATDSQEDPEQRKMYRKRHILLLTRKIIHEP